MKTHRISAKLMDRCIHLLSLQSHLLKSAIKLSGPKLCRLLLNHLASWGTNAQVQSTTAWSLDFSFLFSWTVGCTIVDAGYERQGTAQMDHGNNLGLQATSWQHLPLLCGLAPSGVLRKEEPFGIISPPPNVHILQDLPSYYVGWFRSTKPPCD